jgi:hypothetical protein
MTTWLRTDFDQPLYASTRRLTRVAIAAVMAAYLCCCDSTVLCAQSPISFNRSAYSTDSSETGSLTNRPSSLKTRYSPPVHQVPSIRSGLSPVSQSAVTQYTGDSNARFVVPRYPDETITANPALRRDVRRVQTNASPESTAGPFQAAPMVGPELFEPGDSREFSLDASADSTAVMEPDVDNQGRPLFFGKQRSSIQPDYWIISTRNCPQSNSPCNADVCTEFFYRGPSGQVESRAATDFYQSLDPAVPVCFMIHGSLTAWDQSLREGHATYEWLKRAAPNTRFQLVLFTWPSDRALTLLPPIDFSVLGRRSSFNGLYLARVLSKIPGSMSVSLIGHSHGARLVASGLHLLGGGNVNGFRLAPRQQPLPRIRTAMAAAAMDHQWLDPDQRYGADGHRKLGQFAESN